METTQQQILAEVQGAIQDGQKVGLTHHLFGDTSPRLLTVVYNRPHELKLTPVFAGQEESFVTWGTPGWLIERKAYGSYTFLRTEFKTPVFTLDLFPELGNNQ
jgi:hypothetical protein